MGYNGINFDRARMPARQGIIDPSRMGPPQVAVPGGSMRQAIVQQAMGPQQSGPQSVAEILSQSPGDLGGATNAADRQRQIADMLMQGANSRQATDLVTGFSKLGEAFIARGAGKRADKAEAKRDEVASLLMQQALAFGIHLQTLAFVQLDARIHEEFVELRIVVTGVVPGLTRAKGL